MNKLVVLPLLVWLLGACVRVDGPIVAGTDSPDEDVSGYLHEVLQAAQTTPDSAAMRGRLGMAYDVNGFREAALGTYLQAEELDPREFRWPYFAAVLESEGGDFERALASLKRALVIDGEYAPGWMWRGTWLLETGRLDEAMDAFGKAAQGEPLARLGQARVQIAKQDFGAAIELLQPLAAAFDHPFVHRTLGEALRGEGRTEEARVALARGNEAIPFVWADPLRDERNVHMRGYASYQMAQNLSASGRVNEAVAILDRLQSHNPESACGDEEDFFLACNLMNSRSIAEDRLGYPERALETVQRGLNLNPEFVPFHLTTANLYRRQGNLERALVSIDRAIELNPARAFAFEQRGRLLFGLARFADAKTAFETTLDLEPENETTLFYLGLTEVELENWQYAHDRFQRLTDIEPGFARGHVFLARSLLELGQVPEARIAQDRARELGAEPAELRSTERRLRELELP